MAESFISTSNLAIVAEVYQNVKRVGLAVLPQLDEKLNPRQESKWMMRENKHIQTNPR